jgi:hypothetical protein
MHITFTSSATNAYSGIVARASSAAPSFLTCAFGVTAPIAVTTVVQLQTSASGNYVQGLSCAFLVTAPAGYAVVLSYTSFSVAGTDAWTVFDGQAASDPKLGSITSGATAPTIVTSTGASLYITFTSTAASVRDAGVRANVNFLAASSCSLLATGSAGSAYLGLTAAPADCGINGRRLDAGAEPPALRHGPPPATAPCHAAQEREECLVPTRAIRVVSEHGK